MAIRSIEELEKEKIQIDLTGPNGNAYVLLGLAEKLAKQLLISYLRMGNTYF